MQNLIMLSGILNKQLIVPNKNINLNKVSMHLFLFKKYKKEFMFLKNIMASNSFSIFNPSN